MNKLWLYIKRFFDHKPSYTHIPPPGVSYDPSKVAKLIKGEAK